MRAASAITSRVGAEQLRGDGVLVRFKMEVAQQRAGGFVGALRVRHAVRAGEFGHHQAASALVADQAAEYRIGDAGHGREHGSRANTDAANR